MPSMWPEVRIENNGEVHRSPSTARFEIGPGFRMQRFIAAPPKQVRGVVGPETDWRIRFQHIRAGGSAAACRRSQLIVISSALVRLLGRAEQCQTPDVLAERHDDPQVGQRAKLRPQVRATRGDVRAVFKSLSVWRAALEHVADVWRGWGTRCPHAHCVSAHRCGS